MGLLPSALNVTYTSEFLPPVSYFESYICLSWGPASPSSSFSNQLLKPSNQIYKNQELQALAVSTSPSPSIPQIRFGSENSGSVSCGSNPMESLLYTNPRAESCDYLFTNDYLLGHFLKHTVLTHGVSIQSQAAGATTTTPCGVQA